MRGRINAVARRMSPSLWLLNTSLASRASRASRLAAPHWEKSCVSKATILIPAVFALCLLPGLSAASDDARSPAPPASIAASDDADMGPASGSGGTPADMATPVFEIDPRIEASIFGIPGEEAVVYHINHPRPASQYLALRSVENHIRSLGDRYTRFVVVVHGPGIDLLLDAQSDSDRAGMIDVLLLYDVQFVVDRASLTARGLDVQALYAAPHLAFVRSAYRFIAELQMRGYSYVKP